MYRIGDKVVSRDIRKTKYKFYPTEITTGRIKKVYKTGAFIEWDTDPVISCWCRFGEFRSYTALDEFFSEY